MEAFHWWVRSLSWDRFCSQPGWARLVGRAHLYRWWFPVAVTLPARWGGFYFLHLCYGSAYFKYRLILVAMVDELAVVPLHGVGHTLWNRFWDPRRWWAERWYWPRSILGWTPSRVFLRPGRAIAFGVVPPRAATLVDREWFSLEGVFPFGGEPFQEEPHDYFHAQQDGGTPADDQIHPEEDLFWGVPDWPLTLDGVRLRERHRPGRGHHPYRRTSGEVVEFQVDPTHRWGPERLIDPGDGPIVENTSDGPDDSIYRWYTLADWYFYRRVTSKLTQRDLFPTAWTPLLRTTRRTWTKGMLDPGGTDRTYRRARVFSRWFQRGSHLRQRRWELRYLPYYRFLAGVTLHLDPLVSGRSRPSWRVRLRWRRRPPWIKTFWWAPHEVRQTREPPAPAGTAWAQRILPTWMYPPLGPGAPRSQRRSRPRQRFSRYWPLQVGGSLPPTGVTLVALALGGNLWLASWGSLANPEVYLDPPGLEFFWSLLRFFGLFLGELHRGSHHGSTEWAVSTVLPGLPTWFEVLREPPPGGWWSWPFHPGVGANLYVWTWWADVIVPHLEGPFGLLFVDDEQFLHFTVLKSYHDAGPLSWISPPHLPSWALHHPRIGLFWSWTTFFDDTQADRAIDKRLDSVYYGVSSLPEFQYHLDEMVEETSEFELVNTLWLESLHELFFSYLPNPSWLSPREAGLDPRFGRFWGSATPLYNWVSQAYLDRLFPVNLGRLDQVGWDPLGGVTPGWTLMNVPTGWEPYFNTRFLWESFSVVEKDEPPVTDEFFERWVRWVTFLSGLGWLRSRPSYVGGLAETTTAEWAPRNRTGPGWVESLSRPLSDPVGLIQHRAARHLWSGRPPGDCFDDAWDWSPWKDLFRRVRFERNPHLPDPTEPVGVGVGRPAGSISSPPTGGGYLFVVGGGPARTPFQTTPVGARVVTEFSGWLGRPVEKVTPPPGVNSRRRRSNERDFTWHRRGGWEPRPAQYGPRRVRGHDWLTQQNWPTPPAGPTRRWWSTPSPLWEVHHRHHHEVVRYHRFRPVTTPGETEVSQVGLTELLRHRWPGRPGGPTLDSGIEIHLYEDDHNDTFLGNQSEEDYEEWADVESPYEAVSSLVYLTPSSSQLGAVDFHGFSPGRGLVAFSRFGSLPLGSWSVRAPYTQLTRDHLSSWVVWPVAGVDHPGFSVEPFLVGYSLPRFLRRLERWIPSEKPGPDQDRPRPVLTHHLYERHHRGGDLLYPTWGAHLQDELFQVGWVVAELTDSPDDDVDCLEVGSFQGWGAALRVGGPARYLDRRLRPWTQPVIAPFGGYNLERYLVGENLDCLLGSPREALLLGWVGANYLEGYNLEEFIFQDYGVFSRAPQDPIEHPAWGELDEEVAPPRAEDLPPWVVAAALAGAAPGGANRAGRLTGSPGAAEYVRQGDRAHPVWGRLYYRAWLREGRHPPEGRPAPGEGPGLLGGAALRQAGRNALVKAELFHLLGLGEDRLQRERPTEEHLRLWALTEVYFGDTSQGGSLDV